MLDDKSLKQKQPPGPEDGAADERPATGHADVEFADQDRAGDQIVTAARFDWRDLLRTEDWWAVWLGLFVIALVTLLRVGLGIDLAALRFKAWTNPGAGAATLREPAFLRDLLVTWLLLTGLFSLGITAMGRVRVRAFISAFTGLFLLGALAFLLAGQTTMKQYLEYAFWALGIGLLFANTTGLPVWFRPALHSEYYVKTGLVIMGAEVLFSNITKFGFYGLGIAWIVVPLVILFMWWLGTRVLAMSSKPMVMVIAVATSVCGVSAAIAAAAATRAKKTDLTFAVGLSMLFTVIMMVAMPPLAKLLGLGELIGGAWIGNTVDSTGAVVLAGEALGPLAAQVATLVKMIQNILIGFIAFVIAVFFAARVEKTGRASVGAGEIWDRLPKFILGFLLSSLIFSFIVLPGLGLAETTKIIASLSTFKSWAFALAFLTIGLETNFKEMAGQMEGGKPMTLYLVGQAFSLVLSLLMCWIILSGVIFPVPDLTVFR